MGADAHVTHRTCASLAAVKASIRWLVTGGVVGVLGGLALFLWPGPLATAAGAATPLPRLFRAPSYELVDQLDRPVASSDLKGRVRVVVTMDPYCTTLCPLTASKVRNLEALLKGRGLAGSVQFVAFSIDKLAGPAQLRDFLDQEGLDPNVSWLDYLTGPADKVRSVVRDGYHTSYYSVSNAEAEKLAPSTFQARMSNRLAEKAKAPFAIMHQSPLFVVDRHGWVRAAFGDASTVPSDVVVSDVARLVRSGA